MYVYIISHDEADGDGYGTLIPRFIHRRYINYLLLGARAVGLLDVEPHPTIFVLAYLRIMYDEPTLF